MSTVFTCPLADLRHADESAFGGKSANLGELLAAGIPVPPGFAIGADAFRAFLDETGLAGTISGALQRAAAGLGHRSLHDWSETGVDYPSRSG